MTSCRFNLATIETALREVQAGFDPINGNLTARHDAMEDDVVGRMVAGYGFIADLVDSGVDLFALGNSEYLLELNRIVLAGTDTVQRRRFARHFAASERHFYDLQGVGDLVDWYRLHVGESVWERAAGTYIRLMSTPQLYLEGNHRCGALIISYLLVRDCQPPFVLTADRADEFFEPSSAIQALKKDSLYSLFAVRRFTRNLAAFLRSTADERFLRRCDCPATPAR